MENTECKNGTEDRFRITIVGLGLIGGSMAKALKGFRNAQIAGVENNPKSAERALADGTVSKIYENAGEAAANSDLILLCVYPHHIIEFMTEHAKQLGKGTIISDVCGTKTHLYRQIEPLIPEGVEYIGIHPMAGKEIDGFENAEASLFQNASLILTPLPESGTEAVSLMEELASYIGSRYTITSAQLHDDIIAYTSDLMHISATALCMDYHPEMNSFFTAGAFRDCTRIANINPTLWSELLLMNDEYILPHLKTYIAYLQKMETAIAQRDKNGLYELLERARVNKKEMLTR